MRDATEAAVRDAPRKHAIGFPIREDSLDRCSRRAFLGRAGLAAAATLAQTGLGAVKPTGAAPASAREIALAAFARHRALHSFDHYTGILSLQALARLAVAERDEFLFAQARQELLPFVRGERVFKCNFPNYLCGGNGAAFLLWHGRLPEAAGTIRHHAELILHEAPRSRDGIVTRPDKAGTDAVFIDAAFAVCPFLAFAGRALGETAYLEEAWQQVSRLIAVLRNPANGLLHQARGFSRPGEITQDHWSRGNGWGLLALVELIDALPRGDSRRLEAERLAHGIVEACVRAQGPSGLWHQELTRPDSYVETSGSGLILYALGAGMLADWVPRHHRRAFERGLQAYRDYIESDGSVRSTCTGCLSPGEGTIADYVARPARTNDPHAFGPVILAFGIAAQLARNPSVT